MTDDPQFSCSTKIIAKKHWNELQNSQIRSELTGTMFAHHDFHWRPSTSAPVHRPALVDHMAECSHNLCFEHKGGKN